MNYFKFVLSYLYYVLVSGPGNAYRPDVVVLVEVPVSTEHKSRHGVICLEHMIRWSVRADMLVVVLILC